MPSPPDPLAADAGSPDERELAALYQIAGVGVCQAMPPQGRFTRVNRAFCELTGYSEQELLQRTFSDVTHPDDRGADEARALPVFAGEREAWSSEKRYVRRDGAVIWVRVHGRLIRDEDGAPFRTVAIVQDVTEERRTREALTAREALYRQLTEGLPLLVCKADAGGRFDYCNRRWFEFSGLDLAATAAGAWRDLVHLDDREAVDRAWQQGLLARQPFAFDMRMRRRDGVWRWLAVSVTPVTIQDGAVRWIAASIDVTERKEIARALQDRERQLSVLTDSLPALVSYVDRDLRYRFNNKLYEEWFGIARDGLVGRHVREVLGEEAFAVLRPHFERVLAGEAVEYEQWAPYRTGGRHIHASYIPDRDDRGGVRGMFVLVRDVTEQRRVQAELARRVGELSTLLDIAPVAIGVAEDSECLQVRANPAFAKLLGIAPGANASKAALGDKLPFRILREGREVTPAELPLQVAVRTGRAVENHAMEIERDDGSRLTVFGHAAPVRDGEGKVTGGIAAFLDITRQKEVEAELREGDRRKDEFLAMLAHELRNPLAPIRTAAQLLQLAEGQPTVLASAREIIERQVTHLARLVDDLLDVSRITRGLIRLDLQPLELGAVLGRAAAGARPEIEGQGHEFTIDCGDETVWVLADPVRIEQVFVNLLVNAAKYTPPRGRIEVRARREGDAIAVAVSDNGIGIAADLLPFVFDMFVQASSSIDRSKGGLGIGLTLVRRLVEMHGGSVGVASAGPGRGSEFVVRLPVASAVEASGSPPADAPPGPSTRILVVDDNVDYATMVATALRARGHEVRVATDGPSALRVAGEFGPEVAFVDLGLPGIDGLEVARRLRADRATARTRLVAVSGYGAGDDRARSAAAGFESHLVKPVDVGTLLALVHADGRCAGG